jgi:hypothetical protein
VRIALMQKQWFLHVDGNLQLPFKHLQLHLARRIVAVVVQSGFADGAHDWIVRELAQLGIRRVVVVDRMMRMHAGRGKQLARMCFGQSQRMRAAFARSASQDHPAHTMPCSALQHFIEIVLKRFVTEIDANIEQLHG